MVSRGSHIAFEVYRDIEKNLYLRWCNTLPPLLRLSKLKWMKNIEINQSKRTWKEKKFLIQSIGFTYTTITVDISFLLIKNHVQGDNGQNFFVCVFFLPKNFKLQEKEYHCHDKYAINERTFNYRISRYVYLSINRK